MKFQNSSIHGFKVMLCIKKRDERTDGRTNNPEAICPSNFFEVGGIKKSLIKSYDRSYCRFCHVLAHLSDYPFLSEAMGNCYKCTPQPLYNTIVGVHSINHVS